MFIKTQFKSAALTDDGSAAGVVKVASTAGFVKGARVLLGNNEQGDEYLVIAVQSATELLVRLADSKSYAPADVSAYTTAKDSTVDQPAEQVVDVLPQDVPVSIAFPIRTT
jgi:hypothetical protein